MTCHLGWVEEHPFTSLDDEFDSVLGDCPQERAGYGGVGTDHTPDHLDVGRRDPPRPRSPGLVKFEQIAAGLLHVLANHL